MQKKSPHLLEDCNEFWTAARDFRAAGTADERVRAGAKLIRLAISDNGVVSKRAEAILRAEGLNLIRRQGYWPYKFSSAIWRKVDTRRTRNVSQKSNTC